MNTLGIMDRFSNVLETAASAAAELGIECRRVASVSGSDCRLVLAHVTDESWRSIESSAGSGEAHAWVRVSTVAFPVPAACVNGSRYTFRLASPVGELTKDDWLRLLPEMMDERRWRRWLVFSYSDAVRRFFVHDWRWRPQETLLGLWSRCAGYLAVRELPLIRKRGGQPGAGAAAPGSSIDLLLADEQTEIHSNEAVARRYWCSGSCEYAFETRAQLSVLVGDHAPDEERAINGLASHLSPEQSQIEPGFSALVIDAHAALEETIGRIRVAAGGQFAGLVAEWLTAEVGRFVHAFRNELSVLRGQARLLHIQCARAKGVVGLHEPPRVGLLRAQGVLDAFCSVADGMIELRAGRLEGRRAGVRKRRAVSPPSEPRIEEALRATVSGWRAVRAAHSGCLTQAEQVSTLSEEVEALEQRIGEIWRCVKSFQETVTEVRDIGKDSSISASEGSDGVSRRKRLCEGVLIVDDDPDYREALRELLVEVGQTVTCVSDGREALVYLGRARPCVILLDLMMPIMNGWELHAEMKRDPSLSGIPVVVVTAGGSNVDRGSIDAEAFLPKPVDIQRLLEIVSRLCR